ncbi:hypothetical protein [Hymenobacter cheonanensis]|uniref:hypothetical protein n=1 Tax=Hymenobacter sp. CA2-7 TaxID=3063993 RepID=UPI002712D74F|nr:hypothetical protein [Hymenobacter sp. CA2-7]MDO7887973.1 hypothetical protein [Hymenobacter sp. CA2-7]
MRAPLLNPLAPFEADVAAARQRLDQAESPNAYNIAHANYQEARATLKAAKKSLGTTCLAA